MNNIIFCNLRKDRCKRDRAKVLVDVLNRSLFGDRDSRDCEQCEIIRT